MSFNRYGLLHHLCCSPSTRLGFRRAVPEFLRRPFAFVVADRVIKSGLKSQSNPPTMRRMRATICDESRIGNEMEDWRSDA